MESFTSGTLAGNGSFRCEECGYILTLAAADRLSDCPGCGGNAFARASLFTTTPGELASSAPADGDQWTREAREALPDPGEYLAYEEDGQTAIVPLTREWTRIGRSLAANVRFDDPTVSRRHALVVRTPDGVRVLDDRSLNGVFVNDKRVEWSPLTDGDEIIVGRHRLHFLVVEPAEVGLETESAVI